MLAKDIYIEFHLAIMQNTVSHDSCGESLGKRGEPAELEVDNSKSDKAFEELMGRDPLKGIIRIMQIQRML